MSRYIEKILLPQQGVGMQSYLLVHRYLPTQSHTESKKKAYIQATLHADEVPGLLVSHHLIHLLDEAMKANRIRHEIVLIPYANPLGLSQFVLGSHIGRFSLATGVNFNRDWPDKSKEIVREVKDKLILGDVQKNVETIRYTMKDLIIKDTNITVEKQLKRILYGIACDADIVLDLHCDTGTYNNISDPSISTITNILFYRCCYAYVHP